LLSALKKLDSLFLGERFDEGNVMSSCAAPLVRGKCGIEGGSATSNGPAAEQSRVGGVRWP